MTDCLLGSTNPAALNKKVLRDGVFARVHDLHLNKHSVVAKRRRSARADMLALFLKSRQLRLGSVSHPHKLRWAISGMEKVIMKDLVPMFSVMCLSSINPANSRPSVAGRPMREKCEAYSLSSFSQGISPAMRSQRLLSSNWPPNGINSVNRGFVCRSWGLYMASGG